MKDHRDDQTWVTLELTRMGEEKVQDGTLEETIHKELDLPPDFPIFIPAATYRKGTRNVTILLMEGYAFIASGLPDTRYYELEKKPFVNQVLSSHTSPVRTLVTVSERRVEALRRDLRRITSSELTKGDRVRITEGQFRNLEGSIRGVGNGDAFVEVTLRSLEVMATIPLVFLEILVLDDTTGSV
jgi:transcription antitermination factor NusG